jgi:TniQ
MAADNPKRALVRLRSLQPVRPLPVILSPLADELLSSWVSRHAVFLGISDGRLLRHYRIDVRAVRDLDLSLSRRHALALSGALRCSPHVLRNMMQSRAGRVRSALVAIRKIPQICRACERRHAASTLTHGARLRSWMEGWRITCPICSAALEDFRLYTRLFRADPSDPLLVRIQGAARRGEQIMERANRRHGAGSVHTILMRGLLLPQTPSSRMPRTPATLSRLLDLVVPGADEFFRRLAPEIWPPNSRILPLSARVPVLAGVAEVSRRPQYWVKALLSAVAPHHVGLLDCLRTLAAADYRSESGARPGVNSHLLPQ